MNVSLKGRGDSVCTLEGFFSKVPGLQICASNFLPPGGSCPCKPIVHSQLNAQLLDFAVQSEVSDQAKQSVDQLV